MNYNYFCLIILNVIAYKFIKTKGRNFMDTIDFSKFTVVKKDNGEFQLVKKKKGNVLSKKERKLRKKINKRKKKNKK